MCTSTIKVEFYSEVLEFTFLYIKKENQVLGGVGSGGVRDQKL